MTGVKTPRSGVDGGGTNKFPINFKEFQAGRLANLLIVSYLSLQDLELDVSSKQYIGKIRIPLIVE